MKRVAVPIVVTVTGSVPGPHSQQLSSAIITLQLFNCIVSSTVYPASRNPITESIMKTSDAASFTNLPIEVIFRIFFLLEVYDLHAISYLNKTCHAIYKQHLELDFECKAAGVVNGTREVDNGKKLEALRLREERWRTLDMSDCVTVRIPHHPSNLYDLASGFYVLGGVQGHSFFDYIERRTKFLRFTDLSSYRDDTASSNINDEGNDCNNNGIAGLLRKGADDSNWGLVKAADESVIVDFGLCVDEHDLIGLVEITLRCVCNISTKAYLRSF